MSRLRSRDASESDWPTRTTTQQQPAVTAAPGPAAHCLQDLHASLVEVVPQTQTPSRASSLAQVLVVALGAGTKSLSFRLVRVTAPLATPPRKQLLVLLPGPGTAATNAANEVAAGHSLRLVITLVGLVALRLAG